jgi:hypothetical protein
MDDKSRRQTGGEKYALQPASFYLILFRLSIPALPHGFSSLRVVAQTVWWLSAQDQRTQYNPPSRKPAGKNIINLDWLLAAPSVARKPPEPKRRDAQKSALTAAPSRQAARPSATPNMTM